MVKIGLLSLAREKERSNDKSEDSNTQTRAAPLPRSASIKVLSSSFSPMRRARKGKKKITTLIDTEGCTSRHSPRGDAEHAKLQLCAAVSIRPGGRRTLLGKHQPDASFPVHFGIPTKSFFFRMLPGKQFVNYRHARAEREREREHREAIE
jgi:hypothetical protein